MKLLTGISLLFVLVAAAGCKPQNGQPVGLVADASSGPVATVDASVAPVDQSQCGGCQMAPTPAWTFEGIYADAACTVPLAQITVASCQAVPAPGPTNITYVDAIQARGAGTSAAITIADQVAPTAARFRKAGTACVKANEAATQVTPVGCQGQKVCQDANNQLVCTGCRTFANGCPDFEETRMYAAINDPQLKGIAVPKNNMANLQACCNAIAAEAKRQSNAPELVAAAAQCNALAAAGKTGNSPEFQAMKAIAAGRGLPPVCAGL